MMPLWTSGRIRASVSSCLANVLKYCPLCALLCMFVFMYLWPLIQIGWHDDWVNLRKSRWGSNASLFSSLIVSSCRHLARLSATGAVAPWSFSDSQTTITWSNRSMVILCMLPRRSRLGSTLAICLRKLIDFYGFSIAWCFDPFAVFGVLALEYYFVAFACELCCFTLFYSAYCHCGLTCLCVS